MKPATLAASTRVASTAHTVRLLCIFGACIASEVLFVKRMNVTLSHATRQSMSGFYIGMLLSEWALVYGVWQGIRKRGVTIRDLIGGRWNSARAIAIDFGIAIGLMLFWIALVSATSAIMSLLHMTSDNSSVSAILPSGAFEYVLWTGVSLTAGFCEEVAFRGYFQRQFHAMSGSLPIGICLQAIVFGLIHLYEGIFTALLIIVFGILFGLVASNRKSLRPGMVAHAGTDFIFGIVVPLLRK